MTWPTVAVVTTNLDAGTDSPASARSDLLDAVQKLNQQIAHVSTFMATVLDDASASAARTTLGAAASGANTDITSLSAPALGAATATTQAQGTNTTTVATTAFVQIAATNKIQTIAATVASNALTCTLNPTSIDFRSSSLTSGTVNTRSFGSPISIVVPSGATLGTVSGVLSQIVLLAIDNAGTVELAVVNLAGCLNLSEMTLISTTAISAGATAANIIYSNTARSNVPFRVVGIVESTQSTAGTWATGPSLIQGQGGNALNAMSSIGYGQTYQDVTGSRASGTTYYNTTGKPILLLICFNQTSGGVFSHGGGSSPYTITSNAIFGSLTAIVLPGNSYSFTAAVGIQNWVELR